MPERCPKCGSELEENIRAATYGGPLLVCPLDPKDCRIKELERQLEEAKTRAEDMKQRNARLRQERVDYYNGSALEELNAKYNGLLVSYDTLAQKPGRELILESQLSKAQSERDALKAELEEAKAVALASMERGTATDEEKCELACQLAYSGSLLRASEARERELQGKLDAAEAASEKDERQHLQTIGERDDAGEAAAQMYYLITGNSPEWSNVFGYKEAIEDVDDAQQALRACTKKGNADIAALKAERNAALAESRDLKGKVLVLREALRWVPISEGAPITGDRVFVTYTTEKGVWAAEIHWDSVADSDARISHWMALPHPAPLEHPALSNTSATAQQFVEKIEREAVEKFFAIITDPGNEIVWVRPSGRSIHADPRFIRAAILGEKEKG